MENAKILIVEDDAFAADTLKAQLKKYGFHNCIIKNDSKDVLEYPELDKIGIVFMDINLPGKYDGIETAKIILESYDLPIIFITGSKDDYLWKKAKSIEPFAYLFKPFDAKELIISLETALHKYEILNKLRASEIRYRSVVEDQTEMIFLIDIKGNIVFCNKAYKDFFSPKSGFKSNENLFDIISRENKLLIIENMRQLSIQNSTVKFQLSLNTVSGIRILGFTLRKLQHSPEDPDEFQIVAQDKTEEVDIQMDLKRKADFYQNMFEEGLTADFITLPSGKLVDCNNKFLSVYGFPSKEIALDYDLYKLYPRNEERDYLIKELKRKGNISNFEFAMNTYDGREIFILSNMIGVFDEQNNLEQIRGFELDITQQKIAEKALIESEEQSRALFQGNTDPIFITDLDDKCVALNPAFSKLFGYTSQELYGNRFPGNYGIDEGKFKEWVELCSRGHGISEYETIRRSKDGTYIPVSLSVSPIKDSSGNLRFLSFWYRDISERKLIEAEKEKAHAELEIKVRERTAELRALYDQSPIGMCIFNQQGKMIEINEAYKNIWNIKKNNENYMIFEDPYLLDQEKMKKIVSIFQSGGNVRLVPVYYDEIKDGMPGEVKDKWLKHTFYSIYNEDGYVERIVNLVEDVSESKRADEISERYKKQRLITATIIETLEQERKRLSKEIHDGIGQMLTAAKLSIELFEKETNTRNKNLSDAKKIIYNVGNEVENLINALRPAIFDNYGLVKSVEIMCNEFEELTGIKISYSAYDFSERLDHNLELNLYRIIQEGVSNIAKHSKATNASVQLFNRGSTISVIIEDNGIGFDNNPSAKKNSGKVGFGLLNMIERADMLDGNVHIESGINKGTEIHIDIPITIGGEVDEQN